MNKKKSASTELNIELSKMSTVIGLMESLVSELPDSQQKKALLRLCEEGKLAADRGFGHLETISQHASLI
jgi:hypothetical protein